MTSLLECRLLIFFFAFSLSQRWLPDFGWPYVTKHVSCHRKNYLFDTDFYEEWVLFNQNLRWPLNIDLIKLVGQLGAKYTQICTKRNKWIEWCLCQDSALQGCTWPGTTWANEIYFVMNHALGAGSLARPVDQQSSTLPLGYVIKELCVLQVKMILILTDDLHIQYFFKKYFGAVSL